MCQEEPPRFPFHHDAIFVALDTEGTHQVGLATLDTRDLLDLPPGRDAENWIAKIKTKNFILPAKSGTYKTKAGAYKRSKSTFHHGVTIPTTPAGLPTHLRKLFCVPKTSATPSASTPTRREDLRNVIIVGHSLLTDIMTTILITQFNIYAVVPVLAHLDTYLLSIADILPPSLRDLSARLGLKDRGAWHVAGNDAHVTLCCLLQLALDPRFGNGVERRFGLGAMRETSAQGVRGYKFVDEGSKSRDADVTNHVSIDSTAKPLLQESKQRKPVVVGIAVLLLGLGMGAYSSRRSAEDDRRSGFAQVE
ncbi:hypothetical protein LTR66_000653 [Elasticomyces elasticus]|nr:hypothetical protein LTR50_004563 [Elasticomyces elasticus]KAK5000498.1 hypothetical protein LTR66_000653 [Elasticomyces elasticus]